VAAILRFTKDRILPLGGNLRQMLVLLGPGLFQRKLFKGIVSKLTIKFCMCQKCGKMKDYNKKKKMTTSAVG
jgi:hypothetical protein